MNRRSFMQSILALGVAPWVMSNGVAGGVLMPVREIVVPPVIYFGSFWNDLNAAERLVHYDIWVAFSNYTTWKEPLV